MSEADVIPVRCPNCDRPMRPDTVRSDIWRGDTLMVVEDIPAYICDTCVEQFYDDDVTDALRRLAQGESATAPVKREMVVAVYSLEGRIKRQQVPWDPETAFNFA